MEINDEESSKKRKKRRLGNASERLLHGLLEPWHVDEGLAGEVREVAASEVRQAIQGRAGAHKVEPFLHRIRLTLARLEGLERVLHHVAVGLPRAAALDLAAFAPLDEYERDQEEDDDRNADTEGDPMHALMWRRLLLLLWLLLLLLRCCYGPLLWRSRGPGRWTDGAIGARRRSVGGHVILIGVLIGVLIGRTLIQSTLILIRILIGIHVSFLLSFFGTVFVFLFFLKIKKNNKKTKNNK
jgi:hypothetical protein